MVRIVRIGSIEFVLKIVDKFSSVMNNVKKKANNTAKSVGQKWKDASLAIKAAWIAIGAIVIRTFRQIITLTEEAEKAQARLEQQFKNVGIASEENIEAIRKQANELQKLTGISNDEITSSAALAASYGLNFKQIQQLLPALTDLTAFTAKASGAQSQMEDTVKLMGFVLEGQIGRLKIMGITMSDQQKIMIETGSKAERLAAFLEAVEINAGGVAEAMRKTSAGALRDFKNEMADFGKEIGGATIPALAKLTKIVTITLKSLQLGLLPVVSGFLQFNAVIRGAIQDKTYETLGDEIARIRDIANQLRFEIRGLTEEIIINTEAEDELIVKTTEVTNVYDRIKNKLSELEDQRRNIITLLETEGDVNADLAGQLLFTNIEYEKQKQLLEDIDARLQPVTESQEEAITVTLAQARAINKRNIELIRQADLEDDVAGKLVITKEKYDELKQAISDFEKDQSSVTQITLGDTDKVVLKKGEELKAQKKINKAVGTDFKVAVNESQVARDELTEDVTELAKQSQAFVTALSQASELIDEINEKDIEDKSATWTIQVERIASTDVDTNQG